MFILRVFQRWVTTSGAELLEPQWVQAGSGCWLEASECQLALHRELSAAFLPSLCIHMCAADYGGWSLGLTAAGPLKVGPWRTGPSEGAHLLEKQLRAD